MDTPRSYWDDCKRCKAIRFSCLCSAYVKLCNSIEARIILLIPSDEHHCDFSSYMNKEIIDVTNLFHSLDE